MFIGAALEGMSKPFQYPEMLIVGRGFVGMNCGECLFHLFWSNKYLSSYMHFDLINDIMSKKALFLCTHSNIALCILIKYLLIFHSSNRLYLPV